MVKLKLKIKQLGNVTHLDQIYHHALCYEEEEKDYK